MDEPIVAIYPLDSPDQQAAAGSGDPAFKEVSLSIGVTRSKGDNLPIDSHDPPKSPETGVIDGGRSPIGPEEWFPPRGRKGPVLHGEMDGSLLCDLFPIIPVSYCLTSRSFETPSPAFGISVARQMRLPEVPCLAEVLTEARGRPIWVHRSLRLRR